MQLINILQLALLVASQAGATPIPESDAPTPNAAIALVERANRTPVSCGPSSDQRAWPLQSVQDSYDALVTNGGLPNPQKPAAGTRYYPRQYGSGSNPPTDADVVTALDAIPECKTNQTGMKYFEFPLTNPVFTSGPAGSQGPDRVVAISPTPGQGQPRTFTYCLAMTHRGGTSETDPSFRPCTSV